MCLPLLLVACICYGLCVFGLVVVVVNCVSGVLFLCVSVCCCCFVRGGIGSCLWFVDLRVLLFGCVLVVGGL